MKNELIKQFSSGIFPFVLRPGKTNEIETAKRASVDGDGKLGNAASDYWFND